MAIAHDFLLSEVEGMISRAELRAEQQRVNVRQLSRHPSEQRRARKELDANLAAAARLREFRSDLVAERATGFAIGVTHRRRATQPDG